MYTSCTPYSPPEANYSTGAEHHNDYANNMFADHTLKGGQLHQSHDAPVDIMSIEGHYGWAGASSLRPSGRWSDGGRMENLQPSFTMSFCSEYLSGTGPSEMATQLHILSNLGHDGASRQEPSKWNTEPRQFSPFGQYPPEHVIQPPFGDADPFGSAFPPTNSMVKYAHMDASWGEGAGTYYPDPGQGHANAAPASMQHASLDKHSSFAHVANPNIHRGLFEGQAMAHAGAPLLLGNFPETGTGTVMAGRSNNRLRPSGRLTCLECLDTFKNKYTLQRHIGTVHDDSRLWICPGKGMACPSNMGKCTKQSFNRRDNCHRHLLKRGKHSPCYQVALYMGWNPSKVASVGVLEREHQTTQ